MLTSDTEEGIQKFRELRMLKSIFHMQPVYLPTNYIAPKSLENSPFTKALRNTLRATSTSLKSSVMSSCVDQEWEMFPLIWAS